MLPLDDRNVGGRTTAESMVSTGKPPPATILEEHACQDR